jgi:glutamate-5-semialdehyde dehydrogenase
MKELAKNAKKASKSLAALNKKKRYDVLTKMANDILKNKDRIEDENHKDLKLALENDLNKAMLDRLKLDSPRIEAMVEGVLSVRDQEEVVGTTYDEKENEAGMIVKKQRVPLGVILMIFESRPNVVVDCAALALKSSNAIILKGGKEAKHTNEILGNIIQESIKDLVPKESVQVLASDQREVINDLLELEEFIDVVIPRGGHRLIEYVTKNAKMPVIAHFQGLCHMYLDKDADPKMAIDLALNAKAQRPGVCNAIETLLIHDDLLSTVKSELISRFKEKETKLIADEKFKNGESEVTLASPEDWATEYLDNILSIKTVSNLEEAIEHIDQYGSHHTEAIVSRNQEAIDQFLSRVDASCIMVNASTRFNDGGQLGLGAELGISTTKIHAYGPMGAEQMTTARYVVVGNGHTR